jgi:hypothetical protein
MAPSGWNTPGLAVNANGDYEDRNGTIVDSTTKENTRTKIKPTTTLKSSRYTTHNNTAYEDLFTAAFGGDDLSDDMRNYMSAMYKTTPSTTNNTSGSGSYTSSVVGKLMEDHKVITELAKEQSEAIQEVVSDMEIIQKLEENQNSIDDRLNEMEFRIKQVLDNFENSMMDIDARLEYLESKENV